MKYLFFFILIFGTFNYIKADIFSNSKLFDIAIDSLLKNDELNKFIYSQDSISFFRPINNSTRLIDEKFGNLNKKIRFLNFSQDSIIRNNSILFDIKPLEYTLKIDTLNPSTLYQFFRMKVTYQFFVKVQENLKEFEYQKTDTIHFYENLNFNQASHNIEEQSFSEKYLLPAVLYTTSLAVILLLFFVRS